MLPTSQIALTKRCGAIPDIKESSTSVTFVADSASEALTKYLYPNGVLAGRDIAHARVIQDFLTQNHIDDHIASFLRMDRYAAQRAQLDSMI